MAAQVRACPSVRPSERASARAKELNPQANQRGPVGSVAEALGANLSWGRVVACNFDSPFLLSLQLWEAPRAPLRAD